MALISKASLLMVPSTYEQEKLYNVLPSGNRAPDSTDQNSGYDQTRADFTFDRGSNAAATRIGSDGLIKKYRENLALQSNSFNTSPWSLQGSATLTSGQEDKDGGTEAWLLTKTQDWSRVEQTINQTGVWTFSVFAKAGTSNWLALENGGVASDTCYFNLANGTKGSVGSGAITTNIESIGNGWYHCSATINDTSAVQRIYVATSNGNINGSSGSIYIQNAQLETGLVATDYLDSGATTAKAGVLIDLPRINYDANGENGSLLLEPSRSNLVQYSELGTDYSAQGGNLTNNETISPEGYTNAFKFLESSADSNHGFYETLTLSSNTYYAVSVFVKKLGRRYIGLQSWWSSTKGAIAYFDLDNVETKGTYEQGTNYSATNAKIEDYGNDWYRISAVFQSGETTHYYGVVSMDSLWTTGTSYTNTYTGDISKGFYSYGLQVELGSYSTSYIPNHGTSGGVTRAAEGFGDLTLNYGTTFSIMFDIEGLGGSHANNFILRIGTTNPIYLSVRQSDKKMQFYSAISGVGYFATTATKKIALSCDGTSWIWSSDGSSGTLTATGSTDFTYIRVKTDGTAGGGLPSALINSIYVSDEALSASELNTLTTL